jgi:anti-anti-sigma factor
MLERRVVALAGDLDVYTTPTACRALDAIDGPAVVDLSEVRLLGAAALEELARVARRVGRRTVTLVGARPQVRRVLEIVRFDQLFVIE